MPDLNLRARGGRLGVAALASLLATGGVAVADSIIADGDGTTNSIAADIQSNVMLGADQSKFARFGLLVNDNSTDPVNGCNAKSNQPVTLRVTSNQSWLTVSSSGDAGSYGASADITITSCDTGGLSDGLQNGVVMYYKTASTVPAGASASVSAAFSSGGAAGGIYTSGSFTVKTPAAPADTTAPGASASVLFPNGYAFGDWTNRSVSVELSGSDNTGGSGLKEIRYTTDGTTPSAAAGTAAVSGTNVMLSADGEHALKFVAIDNAGNVSSVESRSIKIDKTAPVIDCGTPSADWLGNEASISCTAADATSGLGNSADANFALNTSVGAGKESSNASTGTRDVEDNAGNVVTAGPITGNKVDRKVPTIECGAASGDWSASEESIPCTAADTGVGLKSSADATFDLTTSVGLGNEDSNASTGTRAVEDAVGNSATAGPIPGNKVDRKAPSASLSCPTDAVLLNSAASATLSASDGGSGIAPNGPQNGDSVALDTSSVGSQMSPAINVADAVGNGPTAATTCSYGVIYDASGLFSPISGSWKVVPGATGSTVLNRVKAGSAVPIKFSLAGFAGLKASELTATSVTATINNGSVDPIDSNELLTVSPGASTLQYDALKDQYTLVWKTDSTWRGVRRLTLLLNDGSQFRANFDFVK